MKIAVTATGSDADAQVDPRFGRASTFLIYDTDASAWTAVDNVQNVKAASGAGIQAAQTLAGQGVKVLLTGHCGPNAYRTLSAAGIEVYIGIEGTVTQALAGYQAGSLQSAGGPDVQGHW